MRISNLIPLATRIKELVERPRECFEFCVWNSRRSQAAFFRPLSSDAFKANP